MNKDFTELMLQRQQDIDLQEQEQAYIQESVLTTHQKGEIPTTSHSTLCRLPRPHFNFDRDGILSHVPALLSETLLRLILNH